MSRLIDADALIDFILNRIVTTNNEAHFHKKIFIEAVKMQPTIEAVPVDRNKIIDEFADKLKKRYPIMQNDLFTINDDLHDEIDKIAKQMKGGNG